MDTELITALAAATTRSRCRRGQAGAVLIDPDGNLVAAHGTGPLFTDPPCAGHCDVRERCRHAVHAEMWCLRTLATLTDLPRDWVLAVSHTPCYRCAQLIVLSGIHTVLYLNLYRDATGLEILDRAGVTVRRIGP